jgi:type II secretory pathway component GspD/PulD (secretin)
MIDCEFRGGPFSLEVVALVNSSDELTLEITLSMGKDLSIANNLTRVIIPNNQGVLLGGLFMDNTTAGFNAVPIISQSAIATKLLSSRTKNTTCKEMIILIHPRIIRHNTK